MSDTLPAAGEGRALVDDARSTILSAAFGPEPPSYEAERRLLSWSKSIALNTLRAILSDLRIVEAFQSARHQPTLPVSPLDLYSLIDQRAHEGYSKSSIDRLIASMVTLHATLELPSPADDNLRWKQREIRRRDNRPREQARGLRIKGDVEDIEKDAPLPLSLLSLLESIPDDPAGLRDRAMISAGYDAGLRRSELVRVRLEHIHRLPQGEASIFIPRSKTDQEGEGATAWLSSRTLQHIDTWVEKADIEDGFLFRPLSYRVSATGHLAEGSVSSILKERLRSHLEGLADEGEFDRSQIGGIIKATSAHSLRIGVDQDMIAAGVDIGAIMHGLRWSSPKQPLSYARHLVPATSKLAAKMRGIT